MLKARTTHFLVVSTKTKNKCAFNYTYTVAVVVSFCLSLCSIASPRSERRLYVQSLLVLCGWYTLHSVVYRSRIVSTEKPPCIHALVCDLELVREMLYVDAGTCIMYMRGHGRIFYIYCVGDASEHRAIISRCAQHDRSGCALELWKKYGNKTATEQLHALKKSIFGCSFIQQTGIFEFLMRELLQWLDNKFVWSMAHSRYDTSRTNIPLILVYHSILPVLAHSQRIAAFRNVEVELQHCPRPPFLIHTRTHEQIRASDSNRCLLIGYDRTG